MNRRSLLLLATLWCSQSAPAIEVTEPEGAAHGYPAWCDITGKKVADGEFRQWMEHHRLHVVIIYKFTDGLLYEEDALFREDGELAQEQWSWKETKNGKTLASFRSRFSEKDSQRGDSD